MTSSAGILTQDCTVSEKVQELLRLGCRRELRRKDRGEADGGVDVGWFSDGAVMAKFDRRCPAEGPALGTGAHRSRAGHDCLHLTRLVWYRLLKSIAHVDDK